MNSYQVGFSLRIVGADPDWTSERRQAFLLNPETKFPKSVDPNVWEQAVPAATIAGEVVMPLQFWEDEESMLKASAYEKGSTSLVELVTVLYTKTEIPVYMEAMGLRSSAGCVEDKLLIGYDVADSGMISGLSNCAYGKSDREAAKKFSYVINSHGLFDSIDEAIKFKKFSDNRVPEHKPFFVYGMFLDKEIQ